MSIETPLCRRLWIGFFYVVYYLVFDFIGFVHFLCIKLHPETPCSVFDSLNLFSCLNSLMISIHQVFSYMRLEWRNLFMNVWMHWRSRTGICKVVDLGYGWIELPLLRLVLILGWWNLISGNHQVIYLISCW